MLPKIEKHVLSGAVEKFKMPKSKQPSLNTSQAHSMSGVMYSPPQTSGPMGHHHTLEDILELIAHLDSSGFTAPFDWVQWSSKLPPGWQTDPSLIDNADTDMLRGLMTAHIRVNRHSRGHLEELFRNGYMDKLFHRLEELAGDQS